MKISSVVFDLDGTLVSSHETIYSATLKTFHEFGMDVNLPKVDFLKMIGYHFKDIFNVFNITVRDVDHFIQVYKSFYFDYIELSTLYEGVDDLLVRLKENNFKISLLTTKAQDQAEKIISHFQLDDKFDYLMGRRNGMEHKPSPEPLLFICSQLGIPPSETLMIGDSELDIRCGKNANSFTCAVSFGYRTRKNLLAEKPDFIIDNLCEVNSVIESIHKK